MSPHPDSARPSGAGTGTILLVLAALAITTAALSAQLTRTRPIFGPTLGPTLPETLEGDDDMDFESCPTDNSAPVGAGDSPAVGNGPDPGPGTGEDEEENGDND